MFLAYIITATSTLNYCPGTSWGFRVFVEWTLLRLLFLYKWREFQGVFIFTVHLAWSQSYFSATSFLTQITLFSELHWKYTLKVFLACFMNPCLSCEELAYPGQNKTKIKNSWHTCSFLHRLVFGSTGIVNWKIPIHTRRMYFSFC